ncbi:MAG: hypothetical protein N2506_04955 [Dehalococcoidales bacterium]|nr:hypothetical protein [Dehalococcoidales bacterium]
MIEDGEGVLQYVRRRLGEAVTGEDVERISRELVHDENIPEGTVKRVRAEMKKRGELPGDTNASLVSLKRQFPQRLGRYEVLTPEAVLQELRLQDGDYKIGFIDGIAMLLLAARLNQELATTQAQAMTPMIQMLQALRQEEREAVERAKSSTLDVAHTAAQEAVSGVIGYLEQRIPKGPPPKDMTEMFTRRLDRIWEYMEHMMEQRMFPQAASKPPEGWEVEHIKEERDVRSGYVRADAAADGNGEGGWQASADGNQKVPQAG